MLIVAITLSGCALIARQPYSPAREINYKQLNDPEPTGDRYYLLVFGSQSFPKVPKYTHTWVTFIRVPAAAPGCVAAMEQFSISWMPASLNIRTFRPLVEPGVNLSMRESIKVAEDTDQRISLWGPYEIPAGLYRKLLVQKEFIDSGAIGYQCIDTIGEAAFSGDGSNCIHAISDADSLFRRQAYPLAFFGDTASLHILRQLAERKAIPNPEVTHDWLLTALNLDKHDIVLREYAPPLMRGPIRFPLLQAGPGDPGP
jgi:hypothetical protein